MSDEMLPPDSPQYDVFRRQGDSHDEAMRKLRALAREERMNKFWEGLFHTDLERRSTNARLGMHPDFRDLRNN